MEQKEISELTDQELMLKANNFKSSNKTNAVLIGIVIGIAFYSIIKNGFGFLPIILFVCVMLAIQNGKKSKAIQKDIEREIISRDLN